MPKPKAPKKQKPIEAHRLRLPSASSLSRAVRCPASQSLQRVTEPTSDAAQRGTNLHLFISLAVPKLTSLPIEEARAEALYRRLSRFRYKGRRLRIAYAPASIPVGGSIPGQLIKLLGESHATVVVLTPHW